MIIIKSKNINEISEKQKFKKFFSSKKTIKSFKRKNSVASRDNNRNNSNKSNSKNRNVGIPGKSKFHRNLYSNEDFIKDIKLNLDKYIFNFDESILKFIKVKENNKKNNFYNKDFNKNKNFPIKEILIRHNTNNIKKIIDNNDNCKKLDIKIGTIQLSWTNQDGLTKSLMLNQKDSESLLDHPPFQWKFIIEKYIDKILSDDTTLVRPSRRSSKTMITSKII